MEETGTTIHATLMRRNNFLRENPNFFQARFVPIFENPRQPIAVKQRPDNSPNDTARTGAYCVQVPAKVASIETVLRGKR